MTKFFFTLICIFLLIEPKAQPSSDSLRSVLVSYQKRDSVRADLLNQLSYNNWIVDPVKAEALSREALQISKDQSYLKGMAMANRSIGVSNWAQGNYEEGLDVLLTSLSQYQLLKDTLNIANVKMNTGLIYQEQGSYSEALRFYEEALLTFQELNRPKRAVNTLNHIGETYQKQGFIDLAKARYREALKISIEVSYAYGRSTALSNLGMLYQLLGELDSALHYANKALIIQNQTRDWNGKAYNLYNLAMISMKKGDFRLAQSYLNSSLKEAERISSKKLKSDVYLKLKQLAKEQANYKEALKYAELYDGIKDSLFNAEKLRELVRLENKFELEKNAQELKLKEQEVNLLKRDSEISTLWRNLFAVGILAVIIISYFIYSRQRINLKRRKEVSAKNEEVYLANEALAKVELENARLREIELKQKIEFKNKELTSYTLNFIQKNELMESIKSSIDELKKSQDKETIKKLNSLKRTVSSSIHIDKDWQDFKRQFEEVHSSFFSVLKSKYPDLTSNELRLCALLKLNMNLKEAATVMGISPESVKTARYRLRKKLGLDREDNLVEYIISLEDTLS